VTPHFQDDSVTLYHGDSLEVASRLPSESIDCCVTSPPYYGLRDYGSEGQYGLEESPEQYVETMRALFSEIRRTLRPDGTLWLNIGDSYASKGPSGPQGETGARADRTFTASGMRPRSSLPAKNLIGVPWRVALALQSDGWILRNEIIWNKPNGMPDSAHDRLTVKHEHIFLLVKSARYHFDLDAIREPHTTVEPFKRTDRNQWVKTTDGNHHRTGTQGAHPNGKNPGDVWSINTQPFSGAHFAVFPQALPERAILAGCKPGGTVLDPFNGSGTTGLVASKHGRKYVGIDLSREYLDLSIETRLAQGTLDFGEASA
jgi:site-specific DNA-methyltransferase (cytosine-N4-specific)